MKGAIEYHDDPEQDELRRPGFAAIVAEMRIAHPDCTEDMIRAYAKDVWSKRNPT